MVCFVTALFRISNAKKCQQVLYFMQFIIAAYMRVEVTETLRFISFFAFKLTLKAWLRYRIWRSGTWLFALHL